jgi:choline dehydrogenase
MRDAIGLFDAEKLRHVARWLVKGRGKLASNVGEAGAHFRTDAGLDGPDFQLLYAPAFFYDHGQVEHDAPALTIAQSFIAPRSRGSVLVGSADPGRKASVRLNFFSEPGELDQCVAAIRRSREVASTAPLRNHVGRELNPGSHVQSDEELRDWIRRTCQHTYHPSCTARMGPPDTGALDPELRVHGVERLRVADCSALPTITRGNTHAPALMVGERCADFVRGDRAEAPSRTLAAVQA